MILATQNIFAAAAQRDGTGAVPADIAEGPQLALFVAHHDNRFFGNLRGEKTFRIGDGARRAVHFSASVA